MTSTQTTEITNSQIHDLAIEAANHGDEDTRRDCIKALAGGKAARRRVERMIVEDAAWAAEMAKDDERADD